MTDDSREREAVILALSHADCGAGCPAFGRQVAKLDAYGRASRRRAIEDVLEGPEPAEIRARRLLAELDAEEVKA